MASSTKRRASGGRQPDALHAGVSARSKEAEDFPSFVDAPPDDSDHDSSDSESSVYSGLEEEADSSSNTSGGNSSDEEAASDDSDAAIKDVKVGKIPKALNEVELKSSLSKIAPAHNLESTQNWNEYEFDSSDEEDIRNTVGNIPMEWYREYAHLGYNLAGEKILKPKSSDELDKFLERVDNPDYDKTVRDKQTGQDVVLTDADVDTIARIQGRRYPDGSSNPYEEWVDFFSSDVMIHPLSNRPEHKRSFIPSKLERLKVGRLVHAIKMGWIKPRPPPKRVDDDEPEDPYASTPQYDLWSQDDSGTDNDIMRRLRPHIPAPKLQLPGHGESYNPPPEYLLTPEEEAAWQSQEPEDRRQNFVPRKYSSLRLVPSYGCFVNERFERCLDLYLCPRQQKMKMNVNPEDLIPQLPKPKDLQPFPTTEAVVYKGHAGYVRCVAVDPTAHWLATGSEDKTIKFWEIRTGRCLKTVSVPEPVKSMCWNPSTAYSLVAAAVGDEVLLVNPRLGDMLVCSNTDHLTDAEVDQNDDDDSSRKLSVSWSVCGEDTGKSDGLLMKISHGKIVGQVTWHSKGDYFAVVTPQGEKQSVVIHQLTKRRSQNPFTKPKGLVQCVLFHPTKPFFFVATQKYIRIYNLLKQELTKKLVANCKWISAMAVHPAGDNVIIGSYDCRLNWFDMDLSTKPYQTLKHQKKALRSVSFHKKYPLFASASDDGTVVVCHGMVYNDLMQNPLIVPVKILKGHGIVDGLGVLDCAFHPTQPWIFTGGADGTARLFS